MPQGVESLAARFEEMAAPLERQVYFTCLHMMNKREDAEDAAQETMLRAFRKFDSFKGESLFSTWIYTVAVHVCLDAIKKRRETVSLDLLREEGWNPASSEPDAFLQLEEKERKRLLHQAIARIPAEFRAPLVLVDLQQLSYQEAAQVMGIPLGTIKSRVSRARQALYRILSESRELFLSPTSLNSKGGD